MERRVLLAVFLSFLVLYVYQILFVPPAVTPPPDAAAPGESADAEAPGSEPPVTAERAGTVEIPGAVGGISETTAAAVVGEAEERLITVETETVTAVFRNRGAVLESWRLKQYLDRNRQPLELIPDGLAGRTDRPFTLITGDRNLDARLQNALFQADRSETRIEARGGGEARLTFVFRDAAGLHVEKTFVLDPRSYVVKFGVVLEDGERALNPTIRWGPGLGEVTGDESAYVQRPEGILLRDGSVERLSTSDIADQGSYEGPFRLAGVDDHYFLAATINPGEVHVDYAPIAVPVEGTSNAAELVAYAVRYPAPPQNAQFFAGPKDFDVLASMDRELVRAINFGWFAWLIVPLLRSLKWINGYVGNYGWSIIILTVLINAAMFPLRHKSVVSMRRMQELQPEVKAIQDRYGKLKATDPARQKMNVELMNLYRDRGVNPASGCIPMVLTMPVLFAFYSLLSVAIEIRDAPFVGWITDLSAHDPLYVTPVLMGVTMVVQQKMTPTTADPVQQKMMMAMPIVFTFMFLRAPSGLVLYWLVSNVWAIGQQHVTNRLIGPPVVRTVRPPAERRVKRKPGEDKA